MKPTPQPGFHVFDAWVDTIPLEAHPIIFKQVDSTIWTHRHYNMGEVVPRTTPPPGLTVTDTIVDCAGFLMVGSDASIHQDQGIMTCAWMISQLDTQYIQACCNITQVSSLSSYRGELEGIYRALRHVLERHLSPQRLELWCDNKAAIDNLQPTWTMPPQMVQPEADVILATRALVTDLAPIQITFHHVYGHQDTRPRQHRAVIDVSPSSVSVGSFFEDDHDEDTLTSPRALSQAAHINIACDALATDTARHVRSREGTPLPHTLSPPFPGSKALLRIGDQWITSDIAKHVKYAATSSALRQYCNTKYDWTIDISDSISWDTVRRARTGCTPTMLMQTSKILHGWLPTMHQRRHITGSAQCPGCAEENESFRHLFCCTNPGMVDARTAAMTSLERKIHSKGIPRAFTSAFLQYAREAADGQDRIHPRTRQFHPVYSSQNDIGAAMFLRGYFSTLWTGAIGDSKPQHKLAWLLKTWWGEVVLSIWNTRNNILHRNTNYVTEQIHTQLGDRMLWYIQHKEALTQRDQFLARYSVEQVATMTTATRNAWITHLDTARDAWTREQTTLDTGQTLITQFFPRLNIGDG